MERFVEVAEGCVITRHNGAYRQVKMYRRGDRAYAAFGSGMVRLCQGGTTSKTNVAWIEADAGDMTMTERNGAVLLSGCNE